jgi:flagellar motor protein MotB
MTLSTKTTLALALSVVFALTACKPKPGEPSAEQQAAAAAAAAPATAAVVVAAPAAAAAPAPAAATSSAASTAAIADLSKIALIAKPLPPFPYIDYPASVHEAHRSTKESDFDQAGVIVGDKLLMVEGRVKLSDFDLSQANISEFQAKRDYAKAALDMGGVKVNTVSPHDDAFYAANGMGERSDAVDKLRYDTGKKMRYEGGSDSYDVYFFPTATGRSWLVLMIDDSHVRILAIEEKTAASSVKLVAAAAIKSELDSKGHIALYINFDTDKATIRPDGKPAVSEIATLMKQETALKLAVEGHTDNVGEAKHNVSLSRDRAQAVVDALVKDGIDSVRLSASGVGADKPIADNGSDEGRAKNRRVELVKVAKG